MISEATIETQSEATPTETSVYLVYPRRFYVLFVFSLLGFNQSLIWLTFSPIARNAEVYYNITVDTIDLLLNWGSIMTIPCLPLAFILLNMPNGLRYCVIVFAITDCLAAFARILPSIILKSTASNFNTVALPSIHIGQILNAICGPLAAVPVSQFSSIWFPPHERTRATTVLIIANNNIGGAVGFIISPYIVTKPEYVPHLLYIHFGLAFLACVLTLVYFPVRPPSAPSAAAELFTNDSTSSKTNYNWRKFLKDIFTCLSNPSFLFISIVGGLIYGVFNVWPSLYDVLLQPENYTEIQAGWFGFGSQFTGIFGGLVVGYIADRRYFQHSLKSLILISLIACTIFIAWFELCVHSVFYDKHILSSTVITIGLSTGLAGLFAGAALPLTFEAVAEITHPLPESLSASILVQWANVVTLILLFIAPNRDKLINFLTLFLMIVCIILVLLTRFTYERRDEDERKRIEKEQNQRTDDNNLNQASDHYNSFDAPLNNVMNEQQYGTFAETTHQEKELEDQISDKDSNISSEVWID